MCFLCEALCASRRAYLFSIVEDGWKEGYAKIERSIEGAWAGGTEVGGPDEL